MAALTGQGKASTRGQSRRDAGVGQQGIRPVPRAVARLQRFADRKARAACQPLFAPTSCHAPSTVSNGPGAITARARGHAPGCRVEVVETNALRQRLPSISRARNAGEQQHRRRIGRGRGHCAKAPLPKRLLGGTALRDRHFANDTTRTAAQGPYTGSRRHVRRRPCRWTTLHRRRRTHALGPSAHPRATSSTALHRRRPKVPVMGQALRSDRGRPRWPGASTGEDYPGAEKLSGLRIIRDKARAAREVSTNR